MKSVLRYPGSKGNMIKHIIPLIPEHKSYLEPFFGSGAIFFNKEKSAIETINDLDNNIVNLFKVIRERPGELIREISLTPYAREEYNLAFKKDKTEKNEIEKARIFLVKSLQSHGFRTYEKCGWKNDVQGREKAYCVERWKEMPKIIQEATERLKDAQIENMNAVKLIKKFNYKNVFMYLDPPYLLSTRTRKQYKHEMDNEKHIILLETILKSKAKIMISGYESDLYNYHLKDWEKRTFNATAEHGLKRKEVLWFNYKVEKQIELEW